MPKSIDVKLDLRDTADFRLVVPDRHIEVVAGTDADYLVNLDRLGSYGNDVILESSGIPSGSSASFSDDELSVGESSVFSINTSGVTPGTYILSTIDAYEAPTIETESYWVSPTGESNWLGAKKDTPLSGTDCCSIATANANASAGDTVYLREGTYANSIWPTHSGTSENTITWSAYGEEVPTFTVTTNFRWAIALLGVSYHKFIGIKSYESLAFFFVGHGSCHNEFDSCIFDNSGGYLYSQGAVNGWNTAYTDMIPSDHNWFHHCTFSHYGAMSESGGYVNDLGSIAISAGYSDTTSHNTIEDCVFSHGGHDCISVMGQYNVVRNNVFHNDESYFADEWGTGTNSPTSGFFGNRCILLEYGDTDRYDINGIEQEPRVTTTYPGSARHNLIESNRVGHSGTPPDDDGANLIENAGVHTIVRHNYMYNAAACGLYFKTQPYPGTSPATPSTLQKASSKCRAYNNTIYRCGYGDDDLTDAWRVSVGVVGYWDSDFWPWPTDTKIWNNICHDWVTGETDITSHGDVTYEDNYNADPLFVDDDVSDPNSLVLPDLTLSPSSPCINAGTSLTLASGAGNSSTSLTVDDAYPFQDGTWGSSLSTHEADWIAIGTVGNVVQISSINYDTKVITLASAMTWADNADVWLYKDSTGTRVLYGTAPNQGADQVTK